MTSPRLTLGLFAVAFGCSSEEAHPPQFGSDAGAVENARSCKDARGGEPSGSNVLVDGEIASCVGDGIVCSLADIAVFDGVCQIGKAAAVCNSNRWQIECTNIDAGVSDAKVANDVTTD